MGFIESVRGWFKRGSGTQSTANRDFLEEKLSLELERELYSESIRQLEMAMEEAGWSRITSGGEREFSRQTLGDISSLARVMYLKNPLIQRGVEVYRLYVWGQGMRISAKDADINQAIQDFLDDPENRKALSGHQAHMERETELRVDGNLFFVFFSDPTGRVKTRLIQFDEISDIVRNPDDRLDPWYYLREWTSGTTQMRAYYPDWRYSPVFKPEKVDDILVRWDTPVFHVRVGGFGSWKFGVSEVYAALDWAKAYKGFMEDWASIVKAYSRFAWKAKTKGGALGVQAAKAKLATTMGYTGSETNPAPTTGSVFVGTEGQDLEPIKTSGATTSADDARRLLLMVCAAYGLPETFFGDASVGSLATAQSLDRPTELAMEDRQTLWVDVFGQILDYVLLCRMKAKSGLKKLGKIKREIIGERVYETILWGEGIKKPLLDIDFPPLLSTDKTKEIKAIVSAATLDGKALAGTIDMKTTVKLLLTALGQDDVDDILKAMFDEEDPIPLPDSVKEAIKNMQEAFKAAFGERA